MTAAMMVEEARPVIGGVDTHKDFHVAAAVDSLGGDPRTASFPNNAAGHAALLAWLSSHGPLQVVGVEGTGSYGAGLSRHLRAAGVTVLEVNRPNRQARRGRGKSDPLDAVAAARAALAGLAAGIPKAGDGIVEAIRLVRVVRRGAVRARTQTMNQLRAMVDTAPVGFAAQFAGLNSAQFVALAAAGPNSAPAADPTAAVVWAARTLALRWQSLTEQINDAGAALGELAPRAAPGLCAMFGVGPDTAAALLVAGGDNPERLGSEAAFAALCGVNPLPASSGRTRRHRLNRAGNRDANSALWRVALVRMAHHQPTRDYVTRRTIEGLSKREIIRCLKRFIAREVYKNLVADLARSQPVPT